jgi:hypothetical protein
MSSMSLLKLASASVGGLIVAKAVRDREAAFKRTAEAASTALHSSHNVSLEINSKLVESRRDYGDEAGEKATFRNLLNKSLANF